MSAPVLDFVRKPSDRVRTQLIQSHIALLIERLLIEARLLEQGVPLGRMADLPSEWLKATPVLIAGASLTDHEQARQYATELVESFIGRRS